MHAGAPRRVVEPMNWPFGEDFESVLGGSGKKKKKAVRCVLSVAPLGAINLVLTRTLLSEMGL